ncbi:GTP cyclohydrolase I FolE [Fusobacterium mortiferum]|uniref:GTP cyclohydrolase 1 n=1 Tax=Fusobacterium mortiferum TaxID=850 RepID=A0ABS2G123_FUSMR|nr:GTP cyclohydrolase I FolE [Fusobacterium mortiferum]MBM6875116.1 GTP cyclohydrolase I FolE [Fusobacterium mortiferum]
MIDKKAIKEHIRGILMALGDDPDREGLIETPERVAKMYEEIFEGMNYSNDELIDKFKKEFKNDLELVGTSEELVIVKDIDIFSYCEHHLALMYNMKVTVAYIPNKTVIGLSKIARICDMVGKRLQLQERIGKDIAYILKNILKTDNIAVIIQGNHSCMTARGIKKVNSNTLTTLFNGKFKQNYDLQAMLLK